MGIAAARDFTTGPILRQVLGLALPIMGSAFIQMGYTLTDIYWIGHEGSGPMAAVSAVGFYMWLAQALCFMPKLGAEVSIAQSLGAKKERMACRYARHALILAAAMALLLMLPYLLAHETLIGFFSFDSPTTIQQAEAYLVIVTLGLPFTFLNATYFGLYNGYGRSQIPFYINASGLVLNMLLDPILIRGWLGVPAMGVEGAAWATVIAQGVATLLYIVVNLRPGARFRGILWGFRPSFTLWGRLLRLGAPPSIQQALFALIGLTLAKIVAQWGDIEVAVLGVGSQIEAITWMTASGLATALGSFVGQNYTGGTMARIRKGYSQVMLVGMTFAVLATILFLTVGEELFGLFINDPAAHVAGGIYLRVLAYSQPFMVLELVSTGALYGVGRTMVPAVNGVLFNGLRIPLALWWGAVAAAGVWWAISIATIFKGSLITLYYGRTIHQLSQREASAPPPQPLIKEV